MEHVSHGDAHCGTAELAIRPGFDARTGLEGDLLLLWPQVDLHSRSAGLDRRVEGHGLSRVWAIARGDRVRRRWLGARHTADRTPTAASTTHAK
jgi:hypothetical protein